MAQRKPVITLVGVKQAREGFTFIYQGANPGCQDCKYDRVCIKNLEVGRVYTIVKLRDKTFPCTFHEEGVRVVEVIEPDVSAAVPHKSAMTGAVISFQKDCSIKNCENYEFCFPPGLFEKDRCKVLEVGENVSCKTGLSLVKAVLRRRPS